MRRTLLIVLLAVGIFGLAAVAAIRVGLRSTSSPIPSTSDPAPQSDLPVQSEKGWPYDVQCKDLTRNTDGSLTFNGSADDHPTMHGITLKSSTEFNVWNEKCLNIKRAG